MPSRDRTSRPEFPVRWRAVAASFGVVAIAACSGGGTDVTPVCTVSAISVSAPSTTLTVGQSTQAAAAYTAQNCSPTPTLTWTTDDASIASVASDGRITGVAPGGPIVIRAATNGQSGTVSITVVPVPVATVTLAPTTATIIAGQTTTLVATARDAAGGVLTGRAVTWGSSNNAIATVAAGVVTGVTPGGPVTITATIGGVAGTAAVIINPVPVATVSLSPATASLVPTQGVDLVATARDGANNVLTGRTITWTSSNSAVASVASGRVTAVAPGGPVTITATVEGVSATSAITVTVPVYLAYGVANNGTPSAPYPATEAYTGAGDAPTVAKVATGSYEVTIPGMAAGNATQRFVYVNARGSFAQCHPNGTPTNVANGALLLKVICGSVNTGAATDSPFSFVAFGAGVFSARAGFLATPTAAIAASPFSPTSPFTYTSRGTDANITVEGSATAGAYTVKFLALGRVGPDNPENHFSQSWGTAPGTWCADGGWSSSVFSAGVYCYDQTGALVNERFGTLVIDGGRVGKRFAVAWVNDPAGATNPTTGYSWSTGAAVTLAKVGLGIHDVTFPGLAGSASVPVSVIVSSYGGTSSNSHCSVLTVTRTGADLVARVMCVTAGAALNLDQRFTIAVIE
ncbi:MAG: Ig domain-containing protein [Gemmatimonadaceae bacterium]|nr:Ig domain-containing protein [Gemmatimonadaceae bacterium]